MVDPASLQVFRLPHAAAASRGTLVAADWVLGFDRRLDGETKITADDSASGFAALLAIVGLGFILFAAN
ncbi:MAG: hypothetical protein R3C28_12595 [Pirellulaceae bacterium]